MLPVKDLQKKVSEWLEHLEFNNVDFEKNNEYPENYIDYLRFAHAIDYDGHI